MLVYVARHAEAEHNVHDLSHDVGALDVPLTSNGIEQATALAEKLRNVKLEAIYVSQLLRTKQTAAIVNTTHGVNLIPDARINDIVTGMVGRPFSEFRQALATSSDPWNTRLGSGESFEDEKARAIAFLRDLKKKGYRCVLVVTHGGIANIMFGLAHNLNNEQTFNRPIENAALFSFDLDKRLKLGVKIF
jgi:broad specificity phosphatase PhoE